MFINIPDLNQYFKHFNGKFGLLQKLQLLWMKFRQTNKRLTGLAFGVVPKYQALGIDSFMIYECGLLVQNKGWYIQYEMGWAGDWKPENDQYLQKPWRKTKPQNGYFPLYVRQNCSI